MNTLQAHPTSYRNVVLKSKCEAVFIRSAELAGFTHWEYEPSRFRVDDWVPDFWIVGSFFHARKLTRVVMSGLIEYKPAPVTPSYRKLLAERFSKIERTMRRQTMNFILAYGNAFNPDIPRAVEEFAEGEWMDAPTFLIDHLDEARTFRFDLAPL